MVPTCTQKSCNIPTSLMQDDCGEEPEVTARSHCQANAEMSARSNRAVRENGTAMDNLQNGARVNVG